MAPIATASIGTPIHSILGIVLFMVMIQHWFRSMKQYSVSITPICHKDFPDVDSYATTEMKSYVESFMSRTTVCIYKFIEYSTGLLYRQVEEPTGSLSTLLI